MFIQELIEASISNFGGIATQIYNHAWKKDSVDEYISKMYFSNWEPPGVCERRWSVDLEGSISGENQTVGEHSGWHSK